MMGLFSEQLKNFKLIFPDFHLVCAVIPSCGKFDSFLRFSFLVFHIFQSPYHNFSALSTHLSSEPYTHQNICYFMGSIAAFQKLLSNTEEFLNKPAIISSQQIHLPHLPSSNTFQENLLK